MQQYEGIPGDIVVFAVNHTRSIHCSELEMSIVKSKRWHKMLIKLSGKHNESLLSNWVTNNLDE